MYVNSGRLSCDANVVLDSRRGFVIREMLLHVNLPICFHSLWWRDAMCRLGSSESSRLVLPIGSAQVAAEAYLDPSAVRPWLDPMGPQMRNK